MFSIVPKKKTGKYVVRNEKTWISKNILSPLEPTEGVCGDTLLGQCQCHVIRNDGERIPKQNSIEIPLSKLIKHKKSKKEVKIHGSISVLL